MPTQIPCLWFDGTAEEAAAHYRGPQFPFSEAIPVQIVCADQEEADHYWDRLTDGGEESMCGWLEDRFGVSWQVVPIRLMSPLADPDPGRAVRAGEALMQMRRIDIAAVERAADEGRH